MHRFKNSFKVGFLAILFIVALISCRRETLEYTDFGYNYAPLDLGRWYIYDVDSTYYEEFNHDTLVSHFQIMEVYDTLFVTAEGRLAVRIERYKRDSVNGAWQGPRIWWADTTVSSFIKAEENNIYVKLVFPQEINTSWNGNSMNIFGAQQFKISEKDKPLQLPLLSFDSAITVLQYESINNLNYASYSEKYARHVGLAEKTVYNITGYIDVAPPADTLSKPILQRIKSGVMMKITLNSFGFQ